MGQGQELRLAVRLHEPISHLLGFGDVLAVRCEAPPFGAANFGQQDLALDHGVADRGGLLGNVVEIELVDPIVHRAFLRRCGLALIAFRGISYRP